MRLYQFLFSLLFFTVSSHSQNMAVENQAIHTVLNSWHQAATDANYNKYFNFMSDNAIFIGTDATEIWSKKEFEKYAKPHFDKGKAWNFKLLKRNVYFSADKKTAWFDELLDTQMKVCRGSGVLTKVKKEWKISHYVLSISIPNELSKEVVKLKSASDDDLIQKLKK